MIERILLWLCAKFNVNPVLDRRQANGEDAVARGARWDEFYNEPGGLADMLKAMRLEAFEAASELSPEDHEKIYYWSMADRNVRRLQGRIESVIASGKMEAANIEQLERMNIQPIRKSVG